MKRFRLPKIKGGKGVWLDLGGAALVIVGVALLTSVPAAMVLAGLGLLLLSRASDR